MLKKAIILIGVLLMMSTVLVYADDVATKDEKVTIITEYTNEYLKKELATSNKTIPKYRFFEMKKSELPDSYNYDIVTLDNKNYLSLYASGMVTIPYDGEGKPPLDVIDEEYNSINSLKEIMSMLEITVAFMLVYTLLVVRRK